MRASYFLLGVVLFYLLSSAFLLVVKIDKEERGARVVSSLKTVVTTFGVSDLCLSTEARYTRHPAISDRVVPVMDHPGAIDHFPSTLFWAPL
jgi:hypothetical protein